MIKAGIIGATGYAGSELVRILTGHREAEIVWYGSRSYIDKKYHEVYQNMFRIVEDVCRDDNLEELAEEEIATGHMIVYTSADSVLQICGNEDTFGLEELYRCCEIARELTMKDEWKVGRVIARPYVGKKRGEFKRTSNRHDYALKPYGRTALNALNGRRSGCNLRGKDL